MRKLLWTAVLAACLPHGAAGACEASWYRARQEGLTFAHRTMPMGSRHVLCHGGRCAIATVTDRGPAAWTGRCADLSRGLAGALGMLGAGVGQVTLR